MSFTLLLNQFHFIRPFWLLALMPYVAVLVLTLRSKLSRGNWSQVCDAELLPYLLQDTATVRDRWLLPAGALAALLSVIALAGPTWEKLPAPAFRNDSALVILFDLSKTMEYADLKPSRLERARFKISDILRQRKDGQTALIAYSGDAFVVTPLTTDTDTIANQLSALTPAIMPNDGDSLSRALDKAVALFKQAGLQNGQIIVLTDGGGLDDGIERAKELGGYQLEVLGIGTETNEPIPLPSGDFVKDGNGDIILGKMDNAKLQSLAQSGGGAYHVLTSDDSDINSLLSSDAARIPAQKGENENLFLEQWRDQGPWLLLAVLPLAALSFRKGVLTVLLAIMLPWPNTGNAVELSTNWQDLWQTKDQQAQAAYRQGDYNKAAQLFENPDWQAAAEFKSSSTHEREMKKPHSAIGYYNQGNVLAVRHDYEKAIANYAKALNKTPDDQLRKDIEFNKKLVEDALQKKQKDQNQQTKDNNKDGQNQNKQQNQGSKSSNQSEQQPDSQPSGNENQDDSKPEQKPEQSQADLEKQAGQQNPKETPKPEDEKQQPAQAESAQTDDKQEHKQSDSEPAASIEMSKEEQQASEQWLKRIPDDPAGLLRRKFKYQYDQRGQ